jgi:4-azaleucine resistance transporter AzlC
MGMLAMDADMTTSTQLPARKRPLLEGVRATLAIGLSVLPFGLAYGAVAAQTMPLGLVSLMSLTVFAGTAQFVAASMLAQGAAPISILVTTTLLQLRLVLMSASVARRLRRVPRGLEPALAHLITDESFAVTIAAMADRTVGPRFFVGSGLTVFVIWQISSVAGAWLGSGVGEEWGIAYAMPSSLICLLFMLVRDKSTLAVSLAAAGLCIALRPLVGSTWNVLLATVVAGIGGVWWNARRSG